MAFGSALRSSTNDYLQAAEIQVLRRDVDVILNELFSRDDMRFGGLRSVTSLTGLGQAEQLEVLRRQNLIITLVNNKVNTNMLYAEIHPKYNDYGQTPREFERGRRMEEFLTMDTVTLDRILQSYNLPRDRRPDYLLSNSLLGRERLGGLGLGSDRLGDRLGDRLSDRFGLSREAKLIVLFEWLGVDLSSERLGGRLGFENRLGGGLLGGGLLGGSLSGLDGRRGVGL